jgi:hypothetical protein
MTDDERRMVEAGVDPQEARELAAIMAGSVCVVVRDESGKVVEREPVSILDLLDRDWPTDVEIEEESPHERPVARSLPLPT